MQRECQNLCEFECQSLCQVERQKWQLFRPADQETTHDCKFSRGLELWKSRNHFFKSYEDISSPTLHVRNFRALAHEINETVFAQRPSKVSSACSVAVHAWGCSQSFASWVACVMLGKEWKFPKFLPFLRVWDVCLVACASGRGNCHLSFQCIWSILFVWPDREFPADCNKRCFLFLNLKVCSFGPHAANRRLRLMGTCSCAPKLVHFGIAPSPAGVWICPAEGRSGPIETCGLCGFSWAGETFSWLRRLSRALSRRRKPRAHLRRNRARSPRRNRGTSDGVEYFDGGFDGVTLLVHGAARLADALCWKKTFAGLRKDVFLCLECIADTSALALPSKLFGALKKFMKR